MTSRPIQPLRARRPKGAAVRVRLGNRTHVACLSCKERKVRCDGQTPACSSCRRLNLACFIEDPSTKRRHPRDYLEQLQQRVIALEHELQEAKTDASRDSNASWDANCDQSDGDGDDLSSMIGTLSLNAAGSEPTYLGSSSVFAFSRFLKPTLQPRPAFTPASPSINHTTPDSAIPEPCPLPDYHTAIKLSNVYFNNINTQYPFLHEATFREWEDVLADPFGMVFESVPLFYLSMVYAVGATLLPHSGYSSEKLYASAMLFIDDIICHDNMESIQAILLCAVYSLRSFTGTSQWKLTGQALRQCVDLGYHRDQKRLKSTQPQFEREMQKRVFWSAYVMECAASVVLGRPLSLRFQDIDVELPLDIEESQLAPTDVVGSPRPRPGQPPTMMTYAIHGFRIRVLLGRIQTALYSDCSLASSEKYERVSRLSATLERWWAETPPPRPPLSEGAHSFFMTEDFYKVAYNHALMHLYRVNITDRETIVSDEIFFKCLQAAVNTCHGFRRQFLGKPTAFTWSAIHEIFLAGLTYIYCLWTSPACREATRHDQVSSTCMDCTVVLVVLGERWAGAAPFRDIFEVLANRTMTMMSDSQQGKRIQPAPLHMGQETCLPDLEQWIAGVADNTGWASAADWLLNELIEEHPETQSAEVSGLPML